MLQKLQQLIKEPNNPDKIRELWCMSLALMMFYTLYNMPMDLEFSIIMTKQALWGGTSWFIPHILIFIIQTIGTIIVLGYPEKEAHVTLGHIIGLGYLGSLFFFIFHIHMLGYGFYLLLFLSILGAITYVRIINKGKSELGGHINVEEVK